MSVAWSASLSEPMVCESQLDFAHFRLAWRSEEHPEEVLMGDELESIVDGQDGASERAGSSPTLFPR